MSKKEVKLSQEELRKLMKEKRDNLKNQKVDSPFAKYSSSGQLTCSVCNLVIKANNLWVPHIAGKVHKENLFKSKKSNSDSSLKNSVTAVGSVKRSAEQPLVEKKAKTEDFKVPQVPPLQRQVATSSLLQNYSSSDDDSEDDENEAIPEAITPKLPLKPVSTSTNGVSSDSSLKSSEGSKAPASAGKTSSIPEGFCDDPILDAKIRKVEYVDPQEEEWERFKKSIAEETNVSKSIIEEDLQESTTEREIFLIDEEIHNWQRKNDLEVLAEDVKTKAAIKEEPLNKSDSDVDDLDEDDLLDWRTKSIKKK